MAAAPPPAAALPAVALSPSVALFASIVLVTVAVAVWPSRPVLTRTGRLRGWSAHWQSLAVRWTVLAGRAGPGARAGARRARTGVRELCDGLSAELLAGRPPRDALAAAAGAPAARSAAGSTPASVASSVTGLGSAVLVPAALAAARLGGDVAAGLRRDAQAPGCDGLLLVAACWQVGEGAGAGLAASLDRLGQSMRATEDVRVALDAQLAGPRATARMLALLPVIGLLLGTLLGGEPVQWLCTTIPGVAVGAAGLALTALGLWWTAAIARSVERRL
ncbi:MAG: pilus assembly protein TadB [Actinomycetota bacterium]|nr:MAG: pilus assembly protein TadB [Actinomycetota bacterium]